MPLKLSEYEAAPGGAEHPEVLAIPDGEVTLAWHNDYYDGVYVLKPPCAVHRNNGVIEIITKQQGVLPWT